VEHDAYKEAGVDIDAAMKTKRHIRDLVRSTFRPEVLSDIGAFGGLFKPDFTGYKNPVLVSSADGVGTKLKVAIMTNRHDTVGADIVNHCCNDILVMGAAPLFFLDYLAYSRHEDAMVNSIISGMSKACRENKCALIGGEMAELPDVYYPGEYDLAGVIVGVVEQDTILDGSRTAEGDVILGLASTGLHTNGYTLARKLVFQTAGLKPEDLLPGTDTSVADVLLAVHRSYGPSVIPFLHTPGLHALAHITGGGFTGNIDRTLPGHLDALIDPDSWETPPLFRFLVETGDLSEAESYRTFNMGIGMTLTVAPSDAEQITEQMKKGGERVYRIGEIAAGSKKVRLVHKKR